MRWLFVVGFILVTQAARALAVNIDSASARAVISALAAPGLTRDAALRVARMPGNQALVRKLQSYHLPATTEKFADDLAEAAQGRAPADAVARALRFERVKAKGPALTRLMDRIESDPKGFHDWVAARVAMFTPPAASVTITGYLIAGGNSGGFAFGDPVTYLNVAYFDEFAAARSVMAHELYHAVQGALRNAEERRLSDLDSATFKGSPAAHQCLDLTQLFEALSDEGTASLVGDPMALDPATGPLAAKTHNDFAAGLEDVDRSVTLLELSVDGLTGPNPPLYDDVYALGFYVPEILYKLGYVMARDIAAADGNQGLAGLLTQPTAAFAARYMALPLYGKDQAHPRLGVNTQAAVQRLVAGCKVTATP